MKVTPFVLGGALALTPVLAAAQETAATGISSDTIIVTARRNPQDPPVVAAARDQLARTPGAVAVVSNESYEDRTAQGLNEILRDVPGVLAQKRFGEDVRLSIRGSGIDQTYHMRGVLFAQDGVPFTDADGFSDYQKLDALTARYAEVYKGGNALRFGGAQLGGAINFVTPTGRTAQSPNLLRLEGGSFDTLRGGVQLARTWGDWDAFAAITGFQTDGFRENSDQEQFRGTLNLGYRFGEDREVRLIAYSATVDNHIPGQLTLDQALSNPEQGGATAIANDWGMDQEIARVSLQTRWRFDANLVFEGGVYATTTDLYHPVTIVVDQDIETYGAFGRFDWSGEIAGHAADLFWGASYRQGSIDELLYLNFGGVPGFQIGDDTQDASGLDVFAEGRFFVTPHLALVAGGSYGRATRDFSDHLFLAEASRDYEWFSPRIGVLWQSDDGAQIYANITRAVEPPVYFQLTGTGVFNPLDAQESWTGEVGVRGRRGPLIWDVTLYRAELEREILSVYDLASFTLSSYTNADETVHQGIEAGLDWQIAESGFLGGALALRQSYTYSDFRFDGDPVNGDNRLPVAPEHQYRAELRYEHPSGFFVAPSVDWRPNDVFVDYANTFEAPGFTIWSLNAGWELPQGGTVFIDARNLTDARYVSDFGALTDASQPGVNTATFYPGEGRAIFAGVSVRF